jgi:N6-adenosine-specific RNA methylase IME4
VGRGLSELQRWALERIASGRSTSRLAHSYFNSLDAAPRASFSRALARLCQRGLTERQEKELVLTDKGRAWLSVNNPSALSGRVAPSLESLIQSGERFGTIYADPPWRYHNTRTRGAAENHYPTMSLEEIAALPVVSLSAPVSQLWLWTTNAFLFGCWDIVKAWGFTFRATCIWCKPQMGLGNCWRSAHETLVWAVRGPCDVPADHTPIPSWFVFPRKRHSEKPQQVRFWIEDAGPGPRLELFARQAPPGWVVWGNEVVSEAAG